jgi:hypothetical protein
MRFTGRDLQRFAASGLCAAATFAAGLTAIADGDLFWHLAAGREMVRTGRILEADPFSQSALGRPWIDVHWLFQLASYGVFRAGGLLALVLAKAALLAVGALILVRVVAREEPALRWPLAVLLPLALFLARHLLPVRPLVLTLLGLAVFFAVLEDHRRTGRARALWALPVAQVLWVNVQGLAALGPGLMAMYLAGLIGTRGLGARRWYPFEPETAPLRPLALALAGCLAASFVSPFGARAALLPLELLLRITPARGNVFASQVAENVPPFVLERTAPEQIGHFKWYLAALALTFALARGRLYLSHVLAVAALAVLALMANRNVPLLYWLGTPIALLNIGPAAARAAAYRGWTAAWSAAGAGLLALALVAVHREPSLGAPTPFRFPTESARRIAERPGSGTVFAPDHQGGYLEWALHPRFRPYLDTRLILHTADEFSEYLELLDHPQRFDDLQARHRFEYVVLPTGYPDRYLELVTYLARSAEWRILYTDGSEVLFGHLGEEGLDLGARSTTSAVLAELKARYPGPLLDAARLHLAKLELALGHLDEAGFVLAPMTDLGARALRARAYLLAEDLSSAEALARNLLRELPGDVSSLTLLARIAFARGDATAGVAWLRQALDRRPFDPEARALLDHLQPESALTPSERGER